MQSVYRWGARGMFLLHIALGVFFLVGWLFKNIQFIYLPLLISWPASWIVLGYCPLTKWELLLEKKYNSTVDSNAEFIQHNARKYLGLNLPSRPIFTIGLLVFLLLLVLSLSRSLY